MKRNWKILCIGNSFSQDATRSMGRLALSTGAEAVRIVNLYVPGCSVRMHWKHAKNDLPAYRFEDCRGENLMITPNYRISQALAADDWDWVCIQHGSGDGSFYSREESYDCFPNLVGYIRNHVKPSTGIAFNMTWLGEPTYPHREMVFYGSDGERLFSQIAHVTENTVSPVVDKICPIGTAIHNGRADGLGLMTRDGYHLSLGLGRYLAAMTLWVALTDTEVSAIRWMPDTITAEIQAKLAACTNRALAEPYRITKSES